MKTSMSIFTPSSKKRGPSYWGLLSYLTAKAWLPYHHHQHHHHHQPSRDQQVVLHHDGDMGFRINPKPYAPEPGASTPSCESWSSKPSPRCSLEQGGLPWSSIPTRMPGRMRKRSGDLRVYLEVHGYLHSSPYTLNPKPWTPGTWRFMGSYKWRYK